jgi:hypothetical protein
MTTRFLWPAVLAASMLVSSAGHACEVTTGTGGFLIGSRTDYYTEDSRTFLTYKSWGVETLNSGHLAQGHLSDGSATYTTLYFTKDPGAAGAYVIVGGAQQYWPLNNPRQIAEEFIWGDSTNAIPVDIGIDTLAWYPAWGWGGSKVIFWVRPAATACNQGLSVWGAQSLSRDLQSKQGWTQNFIWGSPNDNINIGIGQSYSALYGWGESLYTIFLGN